MKKIIKGRGQGKTYDLIKISAEQQIPILTINSVQYILETAKSMGVEIPKPITLKELNLAQYRNSNKPILVDNAEYVLQALLARPIHALSMNCQKEISKVQIAKLLNMATEDFEIVD